MKLAMTMTAATRPHYLENVLVSLANNSGLEDYTLHFGVEPIIPDVLEVAKNVSFMKTNVHLNAKKLGVRDNPFQTLKRVFDSGVDGVLYLEDDVSLSSDAVNLATWYFSQQDANNYLCLNLYNHDSNKEAPANELIAGDKFSALGIGITSFQWKNYFEPNWYKDPRGWDFCFTNMISSGLKVLQPSISRSHHIGRFGGVHYRANMHDHLYVGNQIFDGIPQTEFYIK